MIQYFKIILLIAVLFFATEIKAQHTDFSDTAFIYFQEIKTVTSQQRRLWNKDIYAPLLLVNPKTREIFANEPDSAGILIANKKIYKGVLPKSVNISNTSLNWSGKKWAMVMLPLSSNKNNRINLLAHELFHRAQQDLGFIAYNPDNSHLDKKEGRIYLRFELEALKKAVTAVTRKEMLLHIDNALSFRKYRNLLFTGSDSSENLLELNEGLCEFTGVYMSGRSKAQMKEHFVKRIDYFISSPSYVRSFAYETTPVYGYLFSLLQKGWNKKIGGNTNLTEFFINSFNIKISSEHIAVVVKKANQYNGAVIVKEEELRELRVAKQLALYKTNLIDSPHIEIPLIKMNMSFDYTRMVPLEGYGTVYPSIRITDVWGVLEAENGALINSSWSKVNISKPVTIHGNKISGDGWKLELNDGYFLLPQTNGLGYIVKKQ